MTAIKRIAMFALMVAIVVSAMGFTTQTASAATCTQYYTVKRGDTLYSIGLKYGMTWKTLAQMNNIANPRLIYAGQKLCVSTTGTTPPPTPGKVPTFVITGVVRDATVSIQTANFPANDTFNVLMGTYGSAGIGGVKAGTLSSGAGGVLTATFNIPASLAGRQRIAIRLESPTSGYFSYNWFYNSSTGGNTGGGQPPVTGYTGIPTFSISAVVKNTSVTVVTKNFPANLVFDVYMGKMGTAGIGGVKVGTLNSGAGGALTATFNIPASLQGQSRIAIRTQNPATGYFSYNWFWNNNAP